VFGTYRGALTIILRTLFWNRCSILMLPNIMRVSNEERCGGPAVRHERWFGREGSEVGEGLRRLGIDGG
jgi:hypothetical protein